MNSYQRIRYYNLLSLHVKNIELANQITDPGFTDSAMDTTTLDESLNETPSKRTRTLSTSDSLEAAALAILGSNVSDTSASKKRKKKIKDPNNSESNKPIEIIKKKTMRELVEIEKARLISLGYNPLTGLYDPTHATWTSLSFSDLSFTHQTIETISTTSSLEEFKKINQQTLKTN